MRKKKRKRKKSPENPETSQGYMDSNHEMTESESAALPLGYTPLNGVGSGIRTHAYRSHNPGS